MIPKTELERTAFWGGVVCLECEALHGEPEEDPGEALCATCGSTEVFGAAFVLRCAELVGDEDD